MRTSRRIWGWCVFTLGLLWLLAGPFACMAGDWRPGLLLLVLGIGLLRLGWNLSHDMPNKTPD